jgi:hypothetical protein
VIYMLNWTFKDLCSLMLNVRFPKRNPKCGSSNLCEIWGISQQCWWIIQPPGIWLFLGWCIGSNILEQLAAFTFRLLQSSLTMLKMEMASFSETLVLSLHSVIFQKTGMFTVCDVYVCVVCVCVCVFTYRLTLCALNCNCIVWELYWMSLDTKSTRA